MSSPNRASSAFGVNNKRQANTSQRAQKSCGGTTQNSASQDVILESTFYDHELKKSYMKTDTLSGNQNIAINSNEYRSLQRQISMELCGESDEEDDDKNCEFPDWDTFVYNDGADVSLKSEGIVAGNTVRTIRSHETSNDSPSGLHEQTAQQCGPTVQPAPCDNHGQLKSPTTLTTLPSNMNPIQYPSAVAYMPIVYSNTGHLSTVTNRPVSNIIGVGYVTPVNSRDSITYLAAKNTPCTSQNAICTSQKTLCTSQNTLRKSQDTPFTSASSTLYSNSPHRLTPSLTPMTSLPTNSPIYTIHSNELRPMPISQRPPTVFSTTSSNQCITSSPSQMSGLYKCQISCTNSSMMHTNSPHLAVGSIRSTGAIAVFPKHIIRPNNLSSSVLREYNPSKSTANMKAVSIGKNQPNPKTLINSTSNPQTLINSTSNAETLINSTSNTARSYIGNNFSTSTPSIPCESHAKYCSGLFPSISTGTYARISQTNESKQNSGQTSASQVTANHSRINFVGIPRISDIKTGQEFKGNSTFLAQATELNKNNNMSSNIGNPSNSSEASLNTDNSTKGVENLRKDNNLNKTDISLLAEDGSMKGLTSALSQIEESSRPRDFAKQKPGSPRRNHGLRSGCPRLNQGPRSSSPQHSQERSSCKGENKQDAPGYHTTHNSIHEETRCKKELNRNHGRTVKPDDHESTRLRRSSSNNCGKICNTGETITKKAIIPGPEDLCSKSTLKCAKLGIPTPVVRSTFLDWMTSVIKSQMVSYALPSLLYLSRCCLLLTSVLLF